MECVSVTALHAIYQAVLIAKLMHATGTAAAAAATRPTTTTDDFGDGIE